MRLIRVWRACRGSGWERGTGAAAPAMPPRNSICHNALRSPAIPPTYLLIAPVSKYGRNRENRPSSPIYPYLLTSPLTGLSKYGQAAPAGRSAEPSPEPPGPQGEGVPPLHRPIEARSPDPEGPDEMTCARRDRSRPRCGRDTHIPRIRAGRAGRGRPAHNEAAARRGRPAHRCAARGAWSAAFAAWGTGRVGVAGPTASGRQAGL